MIPGVALHQAADPRTALQGAQHPHSGKFLAAHAPRSLVAGGLRVQRPSGGQLPPDPGLSGRVRLVGELLPCRASRAGAGLGGDQSLGARCGSSPTVIEKSPWDGSCLPRAEGPVTGAGGRPRSGGDRHSRRHGTDVAKATWSRAGVDGRSAQGRLSKLPARNAWPSRGGGNEPCPSTSNPGAGPGPGQDGGKGPPSPRWRSSVPAPPQVAGIGPRGAHPWRWGGAHTWES